MLRKNNNTDLNKVLIDIYSWCRKSNLQMKKLLLVLVVALATSCGAQKKALESQNALLQQQVTLQQESMEQQRAEAEAQQRQISQQQAEQQQVLAQQEAAQRTRPTRVLREAEPCEELALAEADNMRDFGTATANIESVARNAALRNARNNLAQRIQMAAEGAALDYEQNANEDFQITSEIVSEAVSSQFFAQHISNSRAIKWSVYDLSDGSIQVYVCIEMEKAQEEVLEELGNQLAKEGVLAIKDDRENFIDKIGEKLEDYKAEQRAQIIQNN